MKIIWPLFIVILTLSNTQAKCEKPLKAGYELFPPFFFVNQKRELIGGFDFEFAKLIAQELNCPIKFNYIPWKRLLVETKKGSNDLIFSALETKKRKQWADVSQSYVQVKTIVYINKTFKEKYNIRNRSDLLSYSDIITVALVDGWEYIEADHWNQHFKNIVKVRNDKTILKLIQMGRVQAAILNQATAEEYRKRKINLSNVVPLPPSFNESEYSVLVSKKTDLDVRDQIFDAVTKITKSEPFKELLEKYKLHPSY